MLGIDAAITVARPADDLAIRDRTVVDDVRNVGSGIRTKPVEIFSRKRKFHVELLSFDENDWSDHHGIRTKLARGAATGSARVTSGSPVIRYGVARRTSGPSKRKEVKEKVGTILSGALRPNAERQIGIEAGFGGAGMGIAMALELTGQEFEMI